MNANELADVLEELHEQDKSDGVGHLAMPEAATMLRQQQAEIEALKAELEHMRSFFGCDPAYYGMTYDPKKHGAEE